MPEHIKQPESYAFTDLGGAVILPARVAAYLERYAGLNEFRIQHRGTDPQVDNALVALHSVATNWRASVTGSRTAAPAEVEPESKWLGTTAAANRLGITDRGVRLAIQEERLPATIIDGRWLIDREDLEHFRARSKQ
ncbi:helix-turn-helix domain-containing protein [Pseudolysinimonas sp.]